MNIGEKLVLVKGFGIITTSEGHRQSKKKHVPQNFTADGLKEERKMLHNVTDNIPDRCVVGLGFEVVVHQTWRECQDNALMCTAEELVMPSLGTPAPSQVQEGHSHLEYMKINT